MNRAVLLLGTNLGEHKKNLENACLLIRKNAGEIIVSSATYKTEPWGFESENWFYNRVVILMTDLDVFSLLKATTEIEKLLGRTDKSENHYSDRLLDIDILFFDESVVKTEVIEIPHPRLHLRKFTLIPLAEVMPDFVHPVLKNTIVKLLEKCTDKGQCIKTEDL
jgi:2-amino-4-hydroxy-6-hydroxymethyldihydropteridine diphosphokinase